MKHEKEMAFLEQFLPAGSFNDVVPFFKENIIYLTLTHERKSVLGDYRSPTKEIPQHRISINGNLNPYSFLITLLHEIAHMFTYIKFKNSVQPHGNEWKNEFKIILKPFLDKKYFPTEVEKALRNYLNNPAASTCTDANLFKALYKYDKKDGYILVDEMKVNQLFEVEGKQFQIIEKLRTRARCKNLSNGKMYIFQGIFEVKVLNNLN